MGRSSLPGVLKATIRKRVAFGWESAMVASIRGWQRGDGISDFIIEGIGH
jgi:hypothetical protein